MFFIYLIIITIFCLQVDGPISRGVGGGGGSIPVGSFFFHFVSAEITAPKFASQLVRESNLIFL